MKFLWSTAKARVDPLNPNPGSADSDECMRQAISRIKSWTAGRGLLILSQSAAEAEAVQEGPGNPRSGYISKDAEGEGDPLSALNGGWVLYAKYNYTDANRHVCQEMTFGCDPADNNRGRQGFSRPAHEPFAEELVLRVQAWAEPRLLADDRRRRPSGRLGFDSRSARRCF
jgi:hypothetical protein